MRKKAKTKPRKRKVRKARPRKRLERKLNEGLEETFPASDPPALTDPVRSIKE